jgi:hypothetical protein
VPLGDPPRVGSEQEERPGEAVVCPRPDSPSSTGTAHADATATRDTGRVTTATATTVERSGPGISTALDKYAPEERPRFEAELRDALARASDDLDVSRVDDVLRRWHSRAVIVANPLTSEEQAVVRRARAGDLSGLRARDEHGGWVTV